MTITGNFDTVITAGGIRRVTSTQPTSTDATVSKEALNLEAALSRVRVRTNGTVILEDSIIYVDADVSGQGDNNAFMTYGDRSNTTNRLILRRLMLLIDVLVSRKNMHISEATDCRFIESGTGKNCFIYTGPNADLENWVYDGFNVWEIYRAPRKALNISSLNCRYGFLIWEAGRVDLFGQGVANPQTSHAWLGNGNSGNNSLIMWNPDPSFNQELIRFQNQNGRYRRGCSISWRFKNSSDDSNAEGVRVIYRNNFAAGTTIHERGRFTTNEDGLLVGTYNSRIHSVGTSQVRPTLFVFDTFSNLDGNEFISGGGISYSLDTAMVNIEIRAFLYRQPEGFSVSDTITLTSQIGELDADRNVARYEEFELELDDRLTVTNPTTITAYTVLENASKLFDYWKLHWTLNDNVLVIDKLDDFIDLGSANLRILELYDNNSTYNLGDYVRTSDGNTYVNTTTISTPEAFNASKWNSLGANPLIIHNGIFLLWAGQRVNEAVSFEGGLNTTGTIFFDENLINFSRGIADSNGNSFIRFVAVRSWTIFRLTDLNNSVATGTGNWRFNIADYPVGTEIAIDYVSNGGSQARQLFTIQQEGENVFSLDTTELFRSAVGVLDTIQPIIVDRLASALENSPNGYRVKSDIRAVTGDDISGITAFRGGASTPTNIATTTIATVSSQTVFTLTAGPTNDDAYNALTIFISRQGVLGSREIQDYTGATRTVRLDEAMPFVIQVGDSVMITDNSERDTDLILQAITIQANQNESLITDHVNRMQDLIEQSPDGSYWRLRARGMEELERNGGTLQGIDAVTRLLNNMIVTNNNISIFRDRALPDSIKGYFHVTEIHTLHDQRSFTLANASNSDHAYRHLVVFFQSTTTGSEGYSLIENYVGATRTVTLRQAVGVPFTLAVGDRVLISQLPILASSGGGSTSLDQAVIRQINNLAKRLFPFRI